MAVRNRIKNSKLTFDHEFRFLLKLDPAFDEWRVLVAEWWSTENTTSLGKKGAISAFFVSYIHLHQLDKRPQSLFDSRNKIPDLSETLYLAGFSEDHKKRRHDIISDFLEWVLREKLSQPDEEGHPKPPEYLRNPFPRKRLKQTGKTADLQFNHVLELDSRMEDWRKLAAEWLSTQRRNVATKRSSIDFFLLRYLMAGKLERNPIVFMQRTTQNPAFLEVFLPSKKSDNEQPRQQNGAKTNDLAINNCVSNFLNWVLTEKLSVPDDHGRHIVPAIFHNPVPMLSRRGVAPSETLKTPLPYRYIKELRQMLAEGPNFCDWTWAQQAMESGNVGGDWFVVPPSLINHNDPDCVWRKRKISSYKQEASGLPPVVTELWSPVRAVALYIKLELPLRTLQVRMLDSGESDTWRYESGAFRLNDSPLAVGSEKRPSQRGVFHRSANEAEAGFYINTNKTSDIHRDEGNKGYVIPWSHAPALYWMEKLRNWQERYNPISAPTPWRGFKVKHFGQTPPHPSILDERGSSCFLFRDAVATGEDQKRPLISAALDRPWYRLLSRLEESCFKRGETLDDGSPIRFVQPNTAATSYYPLHALRVSLITAYILDGGLPIQVVSKLIAGHARIIMTLYYTKMGKAYINEVMAEAERKMLTQDADSHKRFLMEKSYEEIGKRFAFMNDDALRACQVQKSAASFLVEDKGICPVGGGLCDVGGELTKGLTTEPSRISYSPVAGYPQVRNCIRCRFFLTGPAFLAGLHAHFNQTSYDAHECAERYNKMSEDIALMENRRAACEQGGTIYTENKELERLSQRHEAEAETMDRYLGDMQACHRLIARSLEIANSSDKDGIQLVATGILADIGYALTETPSEIHQLEVLCENAVIYPETDARKPVLRRSQLLDCMLEMNGKSPVFFRLTPEQQFHAGNAVMQLIQARAGSLTNAVEFVEGERRLKELGVLEETMETISESITGLAAKQIIYTACSTRALAAKNQPENANAS